MDKEKMHIPMPDDGMIEREIQQIIVDGLERKPSFYTFMKTMVQQVGIQNIFSTATMIHLLIMIVATFSSVAYIQYGMMTKTEDLYAYIFFTAPLLFVIFSLYSYFTKIKSDTYEVEMSCKYNVYQMIGFRMFIFSVLTILVNTGMIMLLSALYENIELIRAFLISTTGLFIFSLLFLYILTKCRSRFVALLFMSGWFLGNLFIRAMNEALYDAVLMGMPSFVYVIVLIGCFAIYVYNLKQFIQIKQIEGAI